MERDAYNVQCLRCANSNTSNVNWRRMCHMRDMRCTTNMGDAPLLTARTPAVTQDQAPEPFFQSHTKSKPVLGTRHLSLNEGDPTGTVRSGDKFAIPGTGKPVLGGNSPFRGWNVTVPDRNPRFLGLEFPFLHCELPFRTNFMWVYFLFVPLFRPRKRTQKPGP